jgi:hypothetical protein
MTAMPTLSASLVGFNRANRAGLQFELLAGFFSEIAGGTGCWRN